MSSAEHATIRDTTDESGHYLTALDDDGNVMVSAVENAGEWEIYADDGLELPVARVGDEPAARAWLDFISHLYFVKGK